MEEAYRRWPQPRDAAGFRRSSDRYFSQFLNKKTKKNTRIFVIEGIRIVVV